MHQPLILASASPRRREILSRLGFVFAVVRKFGIRPEETLFFDDSQTNLDAASQLGFKTWLVAEGTEFMEAFGE
jgi:methionine salvage enolase-phosphatase E1